MYSVRLGFDNALTRINELLEQGYEAEALVTSVFTAEKTLRRTLRQLVVSAGFISRIADKIMCRMNGIEAVKNSWELYDPIYRRLSEVISPQDLEVLTKASKMRNKIVHGERLYPKELCKETTLSVIRSIRSIKHSLECEYGYCGWSTAKARRVSQLHRDPKVHMPK